MGRRIFNLHPFWFVSPPDYVTELQQCNKENAAADVTEGCPQQKVAIIAHPEPTVGEYRRQHLATTENCMVKMAEPYGRGD